MRVYVVMEEKDYSILEGSICKIFSKEEDAENMVKTFKNSNLYIETHELI